MATSATFALRKKFHPLPFPDAITISSHFVRRVKYVLIIAIIIYHLRYIAIIYKVQDYFIKLLSLIKLFHLAVIIIVNGPHFVELKAVEKVGCLLIC